MNNKCFKTCTCSQLLILSIILKTALLCFKMMVCNEMSETLQIMPIHVSHSHNFYPVYIIYRNNS